MFRWPSTWLPVFICKIRGSKITRFVVRYYKIRSNWRNPTYDFPPETYPDR